MAFDLKPLGTRRGWSSILHATTGGNIARYGSRTPGIWFISNTNRLHICSAVNGRKNHCFNTPQLEQDVYSKILIRQKQKEDGKYWYEIFVNDKLLHQVVNRKPQAFKNVKFYESDPWHKAAEACLRNLVLKVYKHSGNNI